MEGERLFFFFALTAFPSLSGVCSSSRGTGYFRRFGAYMKLTFITCMTSRGPMASGSYLMWALLVARATEQYKTPLVFMRVDSILCTQEAQVIPLTCKIKLFFQLAKHRLPGKCILTSRKSHIIYCFDLGCEHCRIRQQFGLERP